MAEVDVYDRPVTFSVPEGVEHELVVYARAFGSVPGRCCVCGGDPIELPAATTALYCSKAHRRIAYKIRRGVLEGALGDTPGRCRVCDAALDVGRRVSPLCAARACRKTYRRRGFGHFRRVVKWPHDLDWLAAKVGLQAGDPRLPEIAFKLALAGKVGVYVRVDGTVGEVGRPKPPNPTMCRHFG